MITLQPGTKGFTLIEMIISLGIFVVLLQVVAFSYTRFVTVERQHIGEQEMQEDTRLFLQLFNREARTAFGNTFQTISTAAGNPSNGIVFRNQEGLCVLYEHRINVDAGIIIRVQAPPAPTTSGDANCADLNVYDSANPRRLTDRENTIVTALEFTAVSARPPFLSGAPQVIQLTQQGYINFRMRVRARADQNTETNLQSSVTSHQTLPYTP